jgi:hypothetical protein
VVGSTNANGQVTFTIKPKTIGTIKVTVTRLHNTDNNYNQYRPSQTVCQVGGGGGQSSGLGNITPTCLSITEIPTITKDNILIKFGLPKPGPFSFTIYDISGSKMNVINSIKHLAGYYQEMIHVDDLANGIYFIALQQNQIIVNRKFLILK